MNIKVKHPNGYEGLLYGEHSVVVFKDGKEVLHSGSTLLKTKEELYKLLEEMPETMKRFDAIFEDEDEED
jgi:hypothetical protein